MPKTCEGCGHCCHDTNMFGTTLDVKQFEQLGNEVIYHEQLIDLNDKQLSKGYHVVVLANNETRMRMVGNCSAFNPDSRLCASNVHETDLLPDICRKLLIGGTGCTVIRQLAGL